MPMMAATNSNDGHGNATTPRPSTCSVLSHCTTACGSKAGKPKYQKNSCTSSGVLRNAERYSRASHCNHACVLERATARKMPSSVEKATTMSVAQIVMSQPCSSQPQYLAASTACGHCDRSPIFCKLPFKASARGG